MAYFSKYQIKIEKKYNIEYKEIISEQKNIISQRDDKINEQNNKLDELQNIFALIKFNTKDPNNDYYIIALHLFNIFIKDNNISITNFLFNIDNIIFCNTKKFNFIIILFNKYNNRLYKCQNFFILIRGLL